jgi:hypothetical protein
MEKEKTMQQVKVILKVNVLLALIFLGLIFVFSPGTTFARTTGERSLENVFLGKMNSFSAFENSAGNKLVPASYPLKVRGGRGLRLSFANTNTPSLVKLIVEFSFSSKKAGNGLRSGEGAWMDRGGRPGEPGRLEYYIHVDDAKRIYDYLQSPGAYYTFECYNTGKGFMQVTKAYTASVRID